MNRAAFLQRIVERREPWDIAVVGGGATGVGIAVDAASRGYSVGLLSRAILARAPRAARRSWYMAACVIFNRETSR
ncbi:MAG: hypothetical protein WCF18_03090 [Chthoniobacteraceae bacterium]